jgi:hypothetical protein
MEERNPHAEESMGQRDPEIPAARESPERHLMRGGDDFERERVRGGRRCQGVSSPGPPAFIG